MDGVTKGPAIVFTMVERASTSDDWIREYQTRAEESQRRHCPGTRLVRAVSFYRSDDGDEWISWNWYAHYD